MLSFFYGIMNLIFSFFLSCVVRFDLTVVFHFFDGKEYMVSFFFVQLHIAHTERFAKHIPFVHRLLQFFSSYLFERNLSFHFGKEDTKKKLYQLIIANLPIMMFNFVDLKHKQVKTMSNS